MMQSYDPKNWYWQIAQSGLYSSRKQSAVNSDDEAYQAWLAEGNQPTVIGSMELLIGVLRAANVPPYHLVPSRLIVDRLEAVGKLTAAYAALEAADLYTRQRWNTRTLIYADDPTARALIAAIGADPAEILAPE